MVSVCMGIYNGEKYIEEQLLSILHQTKPPDEVILCDDGSTDATVEIVKGFLKENHLEAGWKLYKNKKNKGYPANFYYAMELCREEIVFLADQDDIWEIHKIENMCRLLENNPKMLAVCCKFGLINEEGGEIHSIMAPAQSKGTNKLCKITIEDVFYKCEWPGMVLAYRREWYQKRMKNWKNRPEKGKIPHDFLLCAWAAEEEGFWQLDQELAYHRRHNNNTGQEEHHIGRLLNKERKLKEIQNYNNILEEFSKGEVIDTQRGKRALLQKQEVMQERYLALANGKIIKVIGNAWKYRKITRIATVFCDIAILILQR